VLPKAPHALGSFDVIAGTRATRDTSAMAQMVYANTHRNSSIRRGIPAPARVSGSNMLCRTSTHLGPALGLNLFAMRPRWRGSSAGTHKHSLEGFPRATASPGRRIRVTMSEYLRLRISRCTWTAAPCLRWRSINSRPCRRRQ